MEEKEKVENVSTEDVKKDDNVEKEIMEDEKTFQDDNVDESSELKEIKEEKKEKKNKQKEKIQLLEEEVAKLKDQLLRNRAELENFKKRVNDEKIKERKYASMLLVSELITPLDNFSRVIKMETEDQNLKNFLIGFKMIDNQITEVLEKDGLVKIEAVGHPFDPTKHQAVDKEHKDDIKPGIVLEEFQTGYMYKDRILRPSMVKVSE